MPFLAALDCVPEPDLFVAPGAVENYVEAHPSRALLVVEVADSSLIQDRLTKAPIYARAGVSQYWIVNLRDEVVEWFDADRRKRTYRQSGKATRGDVLRVRAFGDIEIPVARLLSPRK